MAQPVLGAAYNSMSADMSFKLGNYMTALERRYGDPAAYAAQRAEMAAEQAAVMYSEAKTREQALSAAYGKNREAIRQSHHARMASRSLNRYPPSAPGPAQSHNLAPPAASPAHEPPEQPGLPQ